MAETVFEEFLWLFKLLSFGNVHRGTKISELILRSPQKDASITVARKEWRESRVQHSRCILQLQNTKRRSWLLIGCIFFGMKQMAVFLPKKRKKIPLSKTVRSCSIIFSVDWQLTGWNTICISGLSSSESWGWVSTISTPLRIVASIDWFVSKQDGILEMAKDISTIWIACSSSVCIKSHWCKFLYSRVTAQWKINSMRWCLRIKQKVFACYIN